MRATKADGAITRDIALFISKLYFKHLDACFPVDGLNQWHCDIEALRSDVSFEYGSTKVATLAKKYKAFLRPQFMNAINSQYEQWLTQREILAYNFE